MPACSPSTEPRCTRHLRADPSGALEQLLFLDKRRRFKLVELREEPLP